MEPSGSIGTEPRANPQRTSEPGTGQRLLVDVVGWVCALAGAFYVAELFGASSTLATRPAVRAGAIVVLAVVWLNRSLGLYRPARTTPRRVIAQSLRASFILLCAAAFVLLVAPLDSALRLYLAVAVVFGSVLGVIGRFVLARMHVGCRQRLLIVTTGESSPDEDEILRRLHLAPENIELVGVIEHDYHSQVFEAVSGVDLVVVTPGVPDVDRIGLVTAVLMGGARLLLVPAAVESVVLGGASSTWFGVNGTELDLYRHSTLQGRLKRIFDLVGATSALVMALPIVLAVAVVVRFTSKGPVLFRQTRVGLHGREFRIAKFRTMRADAEAKTGAVFALANDDRITGVGKWLRLTRLDELPQLWNVICGDMSLIGPRPERPEFVVGFAAQISGYELRHGVRPGISGLAQVRAGYSATPEEKLRFDLEYVFGHTLSGDLRIIVQTLSTMLDLSAAEGTAARTMPSAQTVDLRESPTVVDKT